MFFRKKSRIIESELPPLPSSELVRLDPLEGLKKRIEGADLTSSALEAVRNELDKLRKTEPSSPDYSISFNYIEFVLSLPWFKSTPDCFDLPQD